MQYFANPSKSIRCYDVSSRVNVHSFRPDFHRLAKNGAHVSLYKVDAETATIVEGKSESIYNDLELLPGQGRAALQRALQFFVYQNCTATSSVYVKAQRARCPGGQTSSRVYALVDPGTQHVFQTVGILCVSRENVHGGSFRWSTGDFAQLRPGDMAVYDATVADLEITNLSTNETEGYIDFLVFFGNC